MFFIMGLLLCAQHNLLHDHDIVKNNKNGKQYKYNYKYNNQLHTNDILQLDEYKYTVNGVDFRPTETLTDQQQKIAGHQVDPDIFQKKKMLDVLEDPKISQFDKLEVIRVYKLYPISICKLTTREEEEEWNLF